MDGGDGERLGGCLMSVSFSSRRKPEILEKMESEQARRF